MTAISAWKLIMADPLPFPGLAFKIRDAVSKHFGAKRIGGFSGPARRDPQVGDHLDFFLVERAEPCMLTLTARDRHLDVLRCITTFDQRLTITSSVITHNSFGRAYMIPGAPAPRLIVWAMLRRLDRRLAGC